MSTLTLRTWRHAFVGASLLWVGALPTAALAVADRWSGAVVILPALAYAIGGVICHQRIDRSFYWGAVPWPVCARCTGLYVGAAMVSAWTVIRGLPAGCLRTRSWLAVSALPSLATIAYEWTMGEPPSNFVRAGSGLTLGVGVSSLIVSALSGSEEPTAVRVEGPVGSE